MLLPLPFLKQSKTIFFSLSVFAFSGATFSNLNLLLMNIFVGNLNFQTTEEQLQDLFTSFGEVSSVKIVTDKFSGRSRSEEHTSELQSRPHLVCRLLLEKKKK